MEKIVARKRRLRQRMSAPGDARREKGSSFGEDNEARLLREVVAVCAVHDLYWNIINSPVPQRLLDLVASHPPLQGTHGQR